MAVRVHCVCARWPWTVREPISIQYNTIQFRGGRGNLRLVFGLARGGGGRHPRLAACRSDERSAAPMAVKAHPLYKKRYLAAPSQYYKYCCCYYKYCCCYHYC